MSRRVLILRPRPAADETAARARRVGLDPVVAPLFEVRPLAWRAPEGAEAVLLTSANAARHGGDGLRRLASLPCYAVGEATAAAAREAGFCDVRTGPGHGAALLATVAGPKRLVHLCGRDHLPLERRGLAIERRAVYAAEAVDALPAAAGSALAQGALVLLHSPRAASVLAALVAERAHVRLAAISPAAAAAAGERWAAVAVAAAPRDEALLELAAKLCQTGAPGGTGSDGADGL